MTDERPRPARPQYGEYATPDEQEKAANRNVPQRRLVGPPLPPRDPPPPVTAETAPPGLYPTPRHPADRFVTIFMLGLGVFFLLNSIPAYVSFSETLSTVYGQYGAPDFPQPALANSIGIVILVFHVVLYVTTVVISLRRLMRSKVTFFVPMIGFIAFTIVLFVTGFVLWDAEPAYFSSVMDTVMGSLQ